MGSTGGVGRKCDGFDGMDIGDREDEGEPMP